MGEEAQTLWRRTQEWFKFKSVIIIEKKYIFLLFAFKKNVIYQIDSMSIHPKIFNIFSWFKIKRNQRTELSCPADIYSNIRYFFYSH